jgi:subtilase family serine protease
MRKLRSVLPKFVPILFLLSFISPSVFAQATYSQPRIAAAVNDAQVTVLRGNTHPLARAEFDRGSAPATLPMQHMLLVLQRSPAQEAALEALAAEQLDRSSPNYHHWLTATEFGQQYGPAQQDIDTITKWLERHGFQVNNVAVGRTTIDFSGNVAQVQTAFHTSIHQYVVNGEQHWANSSDPAVPTALIPVVAGIRSLHNFHPKPAAHLRRQTSVRGAFTFNNGAPCDVAGDSNDCFAVGPNDFTTIYNVQPVYNNNITGSGITIGIVADSDINLTDVSQFRALFSLPANVPNVIYPTGSSPGKNNDEIEAVLDTEWSGAVAKNATIDLVTAPSSNSTFGGDTAANYIINCQTSGPTCTHGAVPASILSESFGECELGLGTAGNTFYKTMWQQAATEGITVLISSGDNGSANCDIQNNGGAATTPASGGLQVNGLASTPSNVAVGGTDFNDLGTETTYWNQSVGTQSSAMKYIPESTWNDTCTNAQVFPLVGANPPITTASASCSNATVQQQVQAGNLGEVTGGSGGMSNCTTSNGSTVSSCSGGNTKPAWQIAAGTPGTTRDLPDVSLFAGDGFAGSFYVMCELDSSASQGGQGGNACTLGTSPVFVGVGGTSVSVQAFAGIMALVDQQTGARQGNASSVLYALAATQSPANCNSSSPGSTCYFNDVTVGTNAMPCIIGSPDCSATASVPSAPSVRVPAISVRTIRITCALGIGLLLLLGFRRQSQRWLTNAAMCSALVLLLVSVGCGGGGGGGGGGGTGEVTPEGVMTGFSAGLGYDLATGLGSINAANLVSGPLWAVGPGPVSPVTNNRPTVTAPVVTLAIACVLCFAMLFAGLRRRQIRWSTAVLLLVFALSILSAARSSEAAGRHRMVAANSASWIPH